jgi:hypothetical protein
MNFTYITLNALIAIFLTAQEVSGQAVNTNCTVPVQLGDSKHELSKRLRAARDFMCSGYADTVASEPKSASFGNISVQFYGQTVKAIQEHVWVTRSEEDDTVEFVREMLRTFKRVYSQKSSPALIFREQEWDSGSQLQSAFIHLSKTRVVEITWTSWRDSETQKRRQKVDVQEIRKYGDWETENSDYWISDVPDARGK